MFQSLYIPVHTCKHKAKSVFLTIIPVILPFDRPASPMCGSVVIFFFDVPGETKVRYLSLKLGGQQYVPGCQVSVDELF